MCLISTKLSEKVSCAKDTKKKLKAQQKETE